MNLGYTVSAVFSMLLVFLAGNRSGKISIKEFVDHKFIRLTYWMVLYCGLDALWGMFYVGMYTSQKGFTLVGYSVYLMAAVVTLFWFNYMVEKFGVSKKTQHLFRTVAAMLTIFHGLILISNAFTHTVFFVNSEGRFYTSSGRINLQTMLAVNYILMLLYGFYRFVTGKREDRSKYLTGMVYALLPGVFGLGQIFLIDVAMYSLGFSISACAIFVFEKSRNIEVYFEQLRKEEQGEQISIINSLAGDFSTIYSVDIETGGFLIYNRTGDNQLLQKIDNSNLDYFKIAVEKGRKMIHEDDLERFLLIMDRESIRRRFEIEDRFSVVLRLRFGNAMKYIEYRFSNNTGENKNRIIIGVYDIDKAYRKKLRDAKILKNAKERQMALEEEAQLLDKAAHRDIMTGLYNRRAYEDYLEDCKGMPDREDFVYVSLDVNGLKAVNDDLGHDAGDELIKGAAFCMKKALGGYGLVYRHGGDEFSAILHVPEEKLESIFQEFDRTINAYQGKLIQEISVSYGYVTRAEAGYISISELSKIADMRMYEAKNLYYSRKGIDRRGQQEAYDAIRRSYLKILKVDLKADSFVAVYMDEKEAGSDKGFDMRISKWLHDFASSGNVHPDDAEMFYQSMDFHAIKEHFTDGRENIAIHYRRRSEKGYNNALLEIIPAENFSEKAQIVFLYVKNIY